MVIAGITGGIGTGKTTVAKIFKRSGAAVIDADEIAHGLVEPEKPAWKKIVKYFGRKVLTRDLYLDRVALGRIAFSDRRKLERLNGIIHPLVYREIRKKINDIKRADPSAIVILDAPLLIESGGGKLVDKVIVVSTSRNAQIKRASDKFGLSRADILRRIKSQMPVKQKIKFADFVIDNNGSIISTEKQARAIWKMLMAV